MDYGSSIRWTFAPGPRPPLASALARLGTLTARYFPARDAKDLDAERDSTSLSRCLEIDLTKTEITASWQELQA